MPHFLILPTDQPHSSAEVTAAHAGGILDYVSRLDCKEADVLEDGHYVFSVRKSGEANFWQIYQRADGQEVYSELG